MRVTFIKDHQSVYSGNQFYPAGAKSDQRRGDDLIAMGVAVAGWGPLVKGIIQRDGETVEAPVTPVTSAQGGNEEAALHFPPQAVIDVVIDTLRPDFDWSQIKGVSTEISAALNYMGLRTPQELSVWVTSGGTLTDIPGIGKKRAADILAWCEEQ